MGFVSKPLYLFPQFFEDKATEHLLGEGIESSQLNDDKIGRTMDNLYRQGLSSIFLKIALAVVDKYGISTNYSHLDSSSFSVQGKYLESNLIMNETGALHWGTLALLRGAKTLGLWLLWIRLWKALNETSEGEPIPLKITKGYSRDHRPDLKQFIVDLIVSGDGGVPLYLRVADGNEQDKVVFGKIAQEYKSLINFETMIVADSALYTKKTLQIMSGTKWLSRVPLSLKEAKYLVNNIDSKELNKSQIEGYFWKEFEREYGGIRQRWLLVESHKREESDQDKLSEKIEKEKEKALKDLKPLMNQEFTSPEGAMAIANQFSKSLKYHQITDIKIQETGSKTSKKNQESLPKTYQFTTEIEVDQVRVQELQKKAGRFILATNELDQVQLSSEEILTKYKEQQAPERGFGFLKDPLFFADSIFLKSPQRVETMAMLMGLCLLVYSLGQRELRRHLREGSKALKNQLGKLTQRPTCLMDIPMFSRDSLSCFIWD